MPTACGFASPRSGTRHKSAGQDIVSRVRGGSRRLRTYLLSRVSWTSGVRGERGGESVDPVDHIRVRGTARPYRWHHLLSAHAHPGGTARTAGLGRRTHAAI